MLGGSDLIMFFVFIFFNLKSFLGRCEKFFLMLINFKGARAKYSGQFRNLKGVTI